MRGQERQTKESVQISIWGDGGKKAKKNEEKRPSLPTRVEQPACNATGENPTHKRHNHPNATIREKTYSRTFPLPPGPPPFFPENYLHFPTLRRPQTDGKHAQCAMCLRQPIAGRCKRARKRSERRHQQVIAFKGRLPCASLAARHRKRMWWEQQQQGRRPWHSRQRRH